MITVTAERLSSSPMPKKPILRFCHALHDETGGEMRWATIVALARRLDMDVRVAILLAGDCAAAGYVWLDVKGLPYALLPSSARLTDKGWKLVAAKIKVAFSIGRPRTRKRMPRSRSKRP